nr:MAG TPA: terminase small subunit [Caudoviricetes sp.]
MTKIAKGKYQEWLQEDNLIRIESWARQGLTDEQIAKNMGIKKTTFYDWLNKYPDISESLKKGKAPVDFEVENALLKRAIGFEYEETETVIEEVNGKTKSKIKRIKKTALPDTSAIIFWLKNRKPEQWRKLNPVVENKLKAETEKLLKEAQSIETDDVGKVVFVNEDQIND